MPVRPTIRAIPWAAGTLILAGSLLAATSTHGHASPGSSDRARAATGGGGPAASTAPGDSRAPGASMVSTDPRANGVPEVCADPELLLSRSFLPRGRSGARVRVTVQLSEPTDLRLRVVDWDGRTVRELVRGRRPAGALTRSWDGRDQEGRIVPEGPYRIVASGLRAVPCPDGAPGQAAPGRAEAWLTVADGRVYPPRPGFITVALDPGHGGPHDGAVGADGTREADLNLDIGLRLARMLESAGVQVVLTRDTDRAVNEPPRDLTGDGRADETDELAARPDIANQARADLFIAIHNNVAVNRAVGGPSTFYVAERTFGERSEQLARLVQAEMVAALREFATEDWRPYDHGALNYPYYVLRDYDPPRLLRPTQMPGVLSEGLFLSNPRELRLLKQPRVRQAMASAYYRAIGAYLADRGHQVGYRVIDRAEQAVAGRPATYELEVRNQGSEPMKGWDLVVGAVPTEWPYVGRARSREAVGERRIPRLDPGETATLALEVTTPGSGQEWMLLFDARDSDGRPASRGGSPVLQVPLTTGAPVPEAPDPSGP